METPVLTERHGQKTWETPGMDLLRREHCLCLHCLSLKPNQPENCKIAQQLFDLAQKNGLAMILTRCMYWSEII